MYTFHQKKIFSIKKSLKIIFSKIVPRVSQDIVRGPKDLVLVQKVLETALADHKRG